MIETKEDSQYLLNMKTLGIWKHRNNKIEDKEVHGQQNKGYYE